MGSTMTEDYDEEIETALIEPRFPQWYGITDHGTGMLMLAFQHGMPSVSIFFQLVWTSDYNLTYILIRKRCNEYPSVEHAYNSMKAEMLNRRELLTQIMRETSSQVQSVLSGITCHEWERVKVSVMHGYCWISLSIVQSSMKKTQAVNGLKVHIVEVPGITWGILICEVCTRRTNVDNFEMV